MVTVSNLVQVPRFTHHQGLAQHRGSLNRRLEVVDIVTAPFLQNIAGALARRLPEAAARRSAQRRERNGNGAMATAQ